MTTCIISVDIISKKVEIGRGGKLKEIERGRGSEGIGRGREKKKSISA
jgi:hypothetical protein